MSLYIESTFTTMARFITLSVFFYILLIPSPTMGMSNSEITIDLQSNSLVSEEGINYQWYHNEIKLEGANSKNLHIKESGKYSVVVNNLDGKKYASDITVGITATGAIFKIYLIGDSTVMSYKASDYPQTGWGQVLGSFFNAGNVTIANHAIGGRSSRTFYTEGRWTTVKNLLNKGDYVFIQFGHNDRDTKPERFTSVADYKTYLTTYCKDAKAEGAIPVLVSPMVMNAWSGTTMRNVFAENGNNYRGAMAEVATTLNVAFIDLNMKSWNEYKLNNATYNSRFFYKGFVAGEYPNFPSGITDNTHFQEMGSISHCRMIVEGIKELSNRTDMANLASSLKVLYTLTTQVVPSGSADMTTKTSTYPQGLTVTLKTIPKSGKTFQSWVSATSNKISSTTLTTIISGNASAQYFAQYQGGVITANEMSQGLTEFTVHPNPSNNTFNITGSGDFKYTILDLYGKSLENGQAVNNVNIGSNLPSGSYMVKIQEDENLTMYQIVKE